MGIDKPTPDDKLKKVAENLADEMGEMNNNPYLNLSEDEIQKVLLMDNVELNNFLKDRKIDFSKPTLLKTPDGVAEPWMNSPEDIKTFLAKCHSN